MDSHHSQYQQKTKQKKQPGQLGGPDKALFKTEQEKSEFDRMMAGSCEIEPLALDIKDGKTVGALKTEQSMNMTQSYLQTSPNYGSPRYSEKRSGSS